MTMTTTLTVSETAASPQAAATADQESAALDMTGCELTDEETTAVVAVLARLAAVEPVGSDAGGTGPADRTLQRRHRLQLDQHGLWGRPGPSSWQTAGGML